MPTIFKSGPDAGSVLTWLGWADEDYLAARTLLLENLLVQGAAFSNTAIEKYFKTLFVLQALPFPRTHNIVSLFQEIKAQGINLKLNDQYLQLLVKAYKMRYPDDLEPGFNFAMVQTKMLVELDATVHTIRKGFGFRKDGKPITTRFDLLVTDENSLLVKRNCCFGNQNRQTLFREASGCYEIRVLATDPTFRQASYQVTSLDDDGVFNMEGLKPGIGNTST